MSTESTLPPLFPCALCGSRSQKRSRATDRHEEAARRKRATVTDLTALLPDDVLADILRCLAPRRLAASRCVCKAWRAVIDARRLLRAELLPLTLGGIFINFSGWGITELFSCPSTTISGKRDYLPDPISFSWSEISDHCNGLLLIKDYWEDDVRYYVLNPATRWVVPLPPCPAPRLEMHTYQKQYLAYDPTISPHYQVFSITTCFQAVHDIFRPEDKLDPVVEKFKWPPSVFSIHVLSSRTGQWEERSFAREGPPVWTVADMRRERMPVVQHSAAAVYWHGALYVHCNPDFVMRISLLGDNKYRVIKLPVVKNKTQVFLGKLGNRVCYAAVVGRCRIRVWILDESSRKTEWVLKHDSSLLQWLSRNKLEYARPLRTCRHKVQGPWTLQDINCSYSPDDEVDSMETPFEKEPESSSQVDMRETFSRFNNKNGYDKCDAGDIRILAFHPYEEIIYLGESLTRGLSYHLDSLEIKILGNIYPVEYSDQPLQHQHIRSSFPYTPCWLGEDCG